MRHLLRRLRSRFGHASPRFLRDIDRNLGFDREEEANRLIKIVRAHTMLPYARLVTLYQQVVFCEESRIPGSFVECGVWKGGAVGLMALANLQAGFERRHLHLFDAFDDICQPDSKVDGERAIQHAKRLTDGSAETEGKLEPVRGIYDKFGGPGTLAGNRRLLETIINYDGEYLHYHKGWFQNTMPQATAEVGEIAILRLDADWYASMKICLEYLYPKVVPGGFVIVDDYGFYQGCTRAVDEYREAHAIKAYMHHIDAGSRYWIRAR